MTDEFVYLRTGEKCRVLYRDEDQVFVSVQIVYEYFYGDEERTAEEDGPILMLPPDSFYDHPPVRVLSEKVKKLEERITALRAAEMGFEGQASRAKQKYEAKLAEYARLSGALVKLGEFLCGGITHYFMCEKYSKPRILTVEETVSKDYYNKQYGRLLTLRPKKGKELTWSLNQYTDGSGSDWECVPCTSYEEALACGQKWIDGYVAEGTHRARVVEFAREYNLVLPEEYISALIEKEKQGLEKDIRRGDVKRKEARAEKEAYWETLRGE